MGKLDSRNCWEAEFLRRHHSPMTRDDFAVFTDKDGMVKPNRLMLAAIWRTCFFVCLRALVGKGRRAVTGTISIWGVVRFTVTSRA